MRSEEEKKQPQTVPNRSVDDNGESLHQSLPQWGKGDHEVVDEVFPKPTEPNRLSELLQRMGRTVEDACPYKGLDIRRSHR